MTKVTETALVEDVKVREQYMDRVDVLEKVKKLLLLPNLGMATAQQVADFYGISSSTLRGAISEHKEEIVSDGYKVYKRDFFRASLTVGNTNYKKTNPVDYFSFEDGTELSVSNAGKSLFPRRAILRVGMLLRDSKVAKEVRSQLLNIEEKATAEVKVEAINEEDVLLLSIFKADTVEERITATKAYDEFKNRHVAKVEARLAEVETENELLSQSFNKWTPKEAIKKLSNSLSGKRKVRFGVPLAEAYTELFYKHGINVRVRKGATALIDRLDDSEQRMVVGLLANQCREFGVNSARVLDHME